MFANSVNLHQIVPVEAVSSVSTVFTNEIIFLNNTFTIEFNVIMYTEIGPFQKYYNERNKKK